MATSEFHDEPEFKRLKNRLKGGKNGADGAGFDGDDDDDPARLPSQIGGFEIRGELGRGGMGVVYRAFDPELNREFALKVISPKLGLTTEARERLRKEAVSAASLQHPSIVQIFQYERGLTVKYGDAGGAETDSRTMENETQDCIAMQLVEGAPLSEVIKRLNKNEATKQVNTTRKQQTVTKKSDLLRDQTDATDQTLESDSMGAITRTIFHSFINGNFGDPQVDHQSFMFDSASLSPGTTRLDNSGQPLSHAENKTEKAFQTRPMSRSEFKQSTTGESRGRSATETNMADGQGRTHCLFKLPNGPI